MPATLTYPGVYIEELSSGLHTITGVATSIAAFVGWAPKGPTDEATLVQSWSDFQTQFGGLYNNNGTPAYLGYAVNQFFANGGQQAYIIRLIAQQIAPTVPPTNTTSVSANVTIAVGAGTVTFAVPAGVWGNLYGIQIAPVATPTLFDVSVVYAPSGTPLAPLAKFVFNNVDCTIPQTVLSGLTITSSALTAPPSGFYMLSGGADGNGINVASPASASLTIYQPSSTSDGFQFSANNEGEWGNLIAIAAIPAPSTIDPTGTHFTLNVLSVSPDGTSTSIVESFNNLSVIPTDSTYIVTVLNADSAYLTVSKVGNPTKALNQTFPPTQLTPPNPSVPLWNSSLLLSGGNNGLFLDPTLDSGGGLFATALNAGGTATGGVYLLDEVEIFNLLCVPGESDSGVISSLQGYCAGRRAFYIADCPVKVATSKLTGGPIGTDGSLVPNSQYAANSAYYYPWISAPDPLVGNRPAFFPPSGFVAGIYASTDANRGVWKAPAGIETALTGVQGLNASLTDLQNGSLNIQAVNCLRNFRTYGNVVWGSRTMAGADQAGSQWKYVPIRRLALFLESSLYDGTQWVVFEPNDEPLWSQIRLNLGAFMQGLFLQGAFQGTTPQQAYFIKCDSENNPQASIDSGIVNILVGFAPLYPAEFVVIQIQQMIGDL